MDSVAKFRPDSDAPVVRCGFCHAHNRLEDVESARVPSNVRRCAHESFVVWRCPSCRSLHSIGPENLDAYYAKYPIFDQTLSYPLRCAFRSREWHLRGLGLRPGGSVLDYGCAGGTFVDFLGKRGFEATGYDPNVGAHSTKPSRSTRYDAVVSYDVIEHVEDPEGMLVELSQWCRPGGIVVIGTPEADQVSLDELEKYAFELHQPYHRHLLSRTALLAMAKRSGLRTVGVRPRFCYDTPFPFVNTQFIWRYAQSCDNTLDCTLDIPRLSVLARNPSLIAWGLLGYLVPHRGSMVAAFVRDDSETVE